MATGLKITCEINILMVQWCGIGINQSVYKLENETIKYVGIFNVTYFARNRWALASSDTLLLHSSVVRFLS